MRPFIAFLLAASCAACAPALPRYSVPQDAAATGFYENPQRPDLALLEYRIAKYFAWDERPYQTVCAVDGSKVQGSRQEALIPLDPGVERTLLRRFPSLTPSGGCKREELSIKDSDTGVEAAVFDVHELECETATRCSAWAGYYANGTHGWSWYWLDWNGREWKISKRYLGIVLT